MPLKAPVIYLVGCLLLLRNISLAKESQLQHKYLNGGICICIYPMPGRPTPPAYLVALPLPYP
jgi:hypothetical protein